VEKSSRGAELEFLFYSDIDDSSFPLEEAIAIHPNVYSFQGPRQWISNAHNFLYVHATGEILMTAGDDMVFRSDDWDLKVIEAFNHFDDKIALIFGNDLASHSGKIAVHGFFHRHWVHTLGTWVQPGRGVPWDLWSTEVAHGLGRLIYLNKVLIEHIHYRQGTAQANFDDTYKEVYKSNSAFRPQQSYKYLARERRNDIVLLSEQMSPKPVTPHKYRLGSFLARFSNDITKRRRLQSMSNIEIIFALPRKLTRLN
jgi:hypothetical protein